MKKADKVREKESAVGDGNYLFKLDLPLGEKITLFVEALLSSFIYLLIGFVISKILEEYVFYKLPDTNRPNRTTTGFIATGEIIFIVFLLYLFLQLLPYITPKLYPNPPMEHYIFKNFINILVLGNGLIAAQADLFELGRYTFGND